MKKIEFDLFNKNMSMEELTTTLNNNFSKIADHIYDSENKLLSKINELQHDIGTLKKEVAGINSAITASNLRLDQIETNVGTLTQMIEYIYTQNGGPKILKS